MITRKVGAYTILMDDDSPLAGARIVMKRYKPTGQRLPFTTDKSGVRFKLLAARMAISGHKGPVIYINGNPLDLRRENLRQETYYKSLLARKAAEPPADTVTDVIEKRDGTRLIKYKNRRIGTFRMTAKGFYESTFTGTPRYYSSPDQVIREAIAAHLMKERMKLRRKHRATVKKEAPAYTINDAPGAATLRALIEACGHTVLAMETAS